MHIPDGFLATPVWAALDVAAVPAVGVLVRCAQSGFDQARTPLLGAFVFAAQMINFPVGAGTSGHLIGCALLAYTLGPSAAAVTMTAILAIQALIFQDGGILALGANVLNMAVCGTLAAWLPFRLWGSGCGRKAAVFAGASVSVMASATLALSELLVSGIRMPLPVLGLSLALFLISAVLEGAITVAVIGALEAMQPGFVRRPETGRGALSLALLGGVAVLLTAVGVLIASTHPDGLERLAEQIGIASRAHALLRSPMADYELGSAGSAWVRKAGAGVAGLALVFGACWAFGRYATGKRSA